MWYFPRNQVCYAHRANAAIYDESSGLKYLLYVNGDDDEVFDIHNDLAEEHNIFGEHPDEELALRNELVAFLAKHYATMQPPPEEFVNGVTARLNDDLIRN